jgi:F0F1-type ATP synthase assembly protein I
MNKMRKEKDDQLDLLNAFGLFAQIGLTLAIPIIIGIVAGKLLDGALGDGHLFLFIFLGAGIVLGFYAAYRELKRVNVSRRRK